MRCGGAMIALLIAEAPTPAIWWHKTILAPKAYCGGICWSPILMARPTHGHCNVGTGGGMSAATLRFQRHASALPLRLCEIFAIASGNQ